MRHAYEVRFADGESPAPSCCKAASLLLHKTGADQQQHGRNTQEAAPRYYKIKFTYKVLVFTKFPIDSLEEKEKCWKFFYTKLQYTAVPYSKLLVQIPHYLQNTATLLQDIYYMYRKKLH